MKTKWLIVVFLCGLTIFRVAAQEEQLSLPPDFAIAKTPAFSKWEVTFSFGEEKTTATGDSAPPSVNVANGKNAPIHPKQLTVTHTNPLWHAALLMTDGNTMECWGDGQMAYLVLPTTPKPMALGKNGFRRYDLGGFTKFICDYNQIDYPDVEWISPQTYI